MIFFDENKTRGQKSHACVPLNILVYMDTNDLREYFFLIQYYKGGGAYIFEKNFENGLSLKE